MSTNCIPIQTEDAMCAFVNINKLLNARVTRGKKAIQFRLDLNAYSNPNSNHKSSDIYVLYHHEDGWRFRRITVCGLDKTHKPYQLFRNSKRSIWRAFKSERTAIAQFNEYIERIEKLNAI